ncbi:MAG: multicopper oxidase domain-containing protein, partial [Bdellovibrionota bacterium]|nr:multicopper oxidase domain-containing protein [Bdellovibrionota bacterium]
MEVYTLFHKGFYPGPLYTWGYNGSMPGPVMEAFEGERVRIKFKNELPEPTTIHWHGLELPIDMDGASGYSHPPIPPGGSFTYEFDLKQSGTYMYHSGHGIAKQLAMGLSGFFIIHPKKAPVIEVDKDFLLFLQMWTVPPHSIIPDTMDMMFNYFTINGKTAPSTTPLQVKTGEKVRLRFANISMMQHPFHLHGHTWKVVATGAGDNNPSSFIKGNTVLVPVGQTLDVIVEDTKEEGDWLLHCHLPHHVTNNMEIDPVPGEPMHHGEAGMFTVFKVGSHHPKPPHDHSHGHGKEDPSPKNGKHKHHNGPKIGYYEGHIKFENDKVFKMSLDLHKVQEGDEWRKLRAYLKIKLPNQNHSKDNEYLLYYYEHLKYNFKKQMLYLEEDEDY